MPHFTWCSWNFKENAYLWYPLYHGTKTSCMFVGQNWSLILLLHAARCSNVTLALYCRTSGLWSPTITKKSSAYTWIWTVSPKSRCSAELQSIFYRSRPEVDPWGQSVFIGVCNGAINECMLVHDEPIKYLQILW